MASRLTVERTGWLEDFSAHKQQCVSRKDAQRAGSWYLTPGKRGHLILFNEPEKYL
jgi:hypothetical protein